MPEHVLPEVMELLGSTNLLWHHSRDSRAVIGCPGFPDLIIASPRGLLAAECKPNRAATLSSTQHRWRYAILAAGIPYRIWTQESLEDGSLERDLEKLK